LSILRDIAYAIRVFRGQVVVFSLTLAGLAITIALCTAMFSVVSAVAFASSGARDPSSMRRLACGGLFSEPPTGGLYQKQCGYSDYLSLAPGLPGHSLAAVETNAVGLFGSPSPSDRVRSAAVSGNFFSVMDVRAQRGRTLEPRDDAPGAAPVAVLSFGIWQNRFGGDPDIVGTRLRLDGQVFTVVGVLERRFIGAPGDGGIPAAVWITLARSRDDWTQRRALDARDGGETTERRWNPGVDVFARLAPGVSEAALQDRASAVLRARLSDMGATVQPAASPLKVEGVDGTSTSRAAIGAILMAVVGLLVLLACANVANVLLVNAITRAREIATRRALGGSRGRIARQLLTESLVLAACAGGSGYVLAKWLIPVLAASLGTPSSVDVSPDLSVFAFVVAVILVVGAVVGLAPVSFARRDQLIFAFSNGFISTGRLDVQRIRSVLLGAQAAVSVVLLVAGALLGRSLLHLSTLDVGYDLTRLSVASISTRGASPDNEQRWAFWRDAAARIRHRPGVADAALVSIPPFAPRSLPLLPSGIAVNRIEASADYFRTLGLRVLRGRTFTAEEVANGMPVAVICERLANRFWQGEDPVGSTVERLWGSSPTHPALLEWPDRRPDIRIVGVVAHASADFKQAEAPMIVLPIGRTASPKLLVRSATEPSAGLAREIRAALSEAHVDANTVVTHIKDDARRELVPLQTLAVCGAIIGIGTVLLAAMGISGVAGFLVAQRRRDIAIRLSLGATHAVIVRAILRDTLAAVVVGTGVGLVLALQVGRLLRHVLIGIAPTDTAAIAAAIAFFGVAAIVAVLMPARRALGIDAIQALRHD
jgi:putative ABC transport system permease protein